jgi:murein L,D-transpeptidase YafK
MTLPAKLILPFFVFALCVALVSTEAHAKIRNKKALYPSSVIKTAPRQDGVAEARLIAIYGLIGQGDTHTALAQAEQLVADHPNFALAQLVYADLLASKARPLQDFGDVPVQLRQQGQEVLSDLRSESRLRLKALRERPPTGAVPAEFLQLSPQNRHAIAIDASRNRLYLFENRGIGATLIADYYISIGRLGLEKQVEGDQRTPLGVYFITSQLDPKTLKDFYGSGALPINYPNVLDIKRGKTGGGIWLHGTPANQFSRAPQSSDGCLVLANPDLLNIVRQVEIRSTPVLIAKQLTWVPLANQRQAAHEFTARLNAWLAAKTGGKLTDVTNFYAPDFNNNGKSLNEWLPTLQQEVIGLRGQTLEIKNLSLLHWVDSHETMVVTFGEVVLGKLSGQTIRQYWQKSGSDWKIFYEGIV